MRNMGIWLPHVFQLTFAIIWHCPSLVLEAWRTIVLSSHSASCMQYTHSLAIVQISALSGCHTAHHSAAHDAKLQLEEQPGWTGGTSSCKWQPVLQVSGWHCLRSPWEFCATYHDTEIQMPHRCPLSSLYAFVHVLLDTAKQFCLIKIFIHSVLLIRQLQEQGNTVSFLMSWMH
jgi:hypothetical protein